MRDHCEKDMIKDNFKLNRYLINYIVRDNVQKHEESSDLTDKKQICIFNLLSTVVRRKQLLIKWCLLSERFGTMATLAITD